MKIKNIAIKQALKDAEKIQDYYAKVQKLCELSGLVAFYGHTKDNTHESLQECEKIARNTIDILVKRYSL